MWQISLPSVPREWQSDFKKYQRVYARHVGVIAAGAVLVLVSLMSLVDMYLMDFQPDLSQMDSAWRAPACLLAVVILALCSLKPAGAWPRPLLILLGASMIGMQLGMFVMHLQAESGRTEFVFAALMIVVVGGSVLSVYGVRDLAVIYGLPLAGIVLLLGMAGFPAVLEPVHLVYMALAAVTGGVISEILYRSDVVAFVAIKQIERTALTDWLTGLLNRRAIDEQMRVELARAERRGSTFGVIMADLDAFKGVNDRYGHEVGDGVLKDAAQRLVGAVRLEDRVGRWGGEEFLILIPDPGEGDAFRVAERIRQLIGSRPFDTSAGALSVTVSTGVAIRQPGERLEKVIARADAALYCAKEGGRNQSVVDESAGGAPGL